MGKVFGSQHKKEEIQAPPKSELTECSMKLMKILRDNRLLIDVPIISNWNKAFSRLFKIDKEATIKVLDWYALNCGKDYVPEVNDAREFYRKFSSIHSKYKEDPSSVVISDLAKDMLKYMLEETEWKKETEPHLAAILQRSLDNYTPFYSKLKKLCAQLTHPDNKEGRWDGSLLKYLLDNGFFQDPRSFVRYVWMRAVYREYCKRKGNFPVKYMHFRLKSSIFESIGQEVSQEYTGEWKRWDQLKLHWKDW